MHVGPAFVPCSGLNQGQIEWPELLADFLETVVVTAIAGIERPVVRSLEDKGGPQRLETVTDSASREVARWSRNYFDIVNPVALPPVQLDDLRFRASPFSR